MKTGTFLRQIPMIMFCLLIVFSTGYRYATAESAALPAKTTWLWNTVLIKSSPDELISFSKSQGVRIIYLQISSKVDLPAYRDFIKKARLNSIEVHALNGAPNWALTGNQPKLQAFIKWINDYQKSAAEDEKFKGIHVDIEPYILPEWKTDLTSVVSQWQTAVDFLVAEANAAGLPISAALPFWLDNYKTPGDEQTLSSWMISRFHSVTLMSYRDKAASIYDVAKNELAEGERLNKTVYTGVETKASAEGNFITFYEEGYDVLLEQLQQLDKLASAHPSFGGIAVHDLASWMEMAGRAAPLQ